MRRASCSRAMCYHPPRYLPWRCPRQTWGAQGTAACPAPLSASTPHRSVPHPVSAASNSCPWSCNGPAHHAAPTAPEPPGSLQPRGRDKERASTGCLQVPRTYECWPSSGRCREQLPDQNSMHKVGGGSEPPQPARQTQAAARALPHLPSSAASRHSRSRSSGAPTAIGNTFSKQHVAGWEASWLEALATLPTAGNGGRAATGPVPAWLGEKGISPVTNRCCCCWHCFSASNSWVWSMGSRAADTTAKVSAASLRTQWLHVAHYVKRKQHCILCARHGFLRWQDQLLCMRTANRARDNKLAVDSCAVVQEVRARLKCARLFPRFLPRTLDCRSCSASVLLDMWHYIAVKAGHSSLRLGGCL